MARQLVMNIAPIQVTGSEITAGVQKYENEEQLQMFRSTHRESHLFYRDDETILDMPIVAGAQPIASKSKTIDLGKNLSLCAFLIRDALLRYLYTQQGMVSRRYHPISVIAHNSGRDYLEKALPAGLTHPEWLSVKTRFEFTIRVMKLTGLDPFIGLALNIGTARIISSPVDELLKQGMDVRNLYVCQYISSDDPRLSPKRILLGKVDSVDGDMLLLSDTRYESSTAHASSAFLESSLKSFYACIDHVYGARAQAVKESLEHDLIQVRTGNNRLNKLQAVLSGLSRQSYDIVPGVSFSIGSLLAESTDQHFPTIREAPKPIYVFDPTGTKTERTHYIGLNTHGPYSSQWPSPSRPEICVICQQAKQGRVEPFVHQLLHGIQSHKAFSKGLLREYELEDTQPKFFPARNPTAESYRQAVQEAIRYQTQHGNKWDLALIQIDEAFRELPVQDNPYYVSKAAFLAHQIPTQEFESETMAYSDYQRGYALNNMALATYAKLGGIPWLLKANPTIAHELVIGIGSASISEGRLAAKERVVGITTLFSGDGSYRLSNISQAVPMDQYAETMITSLRTTLNRIRHDMNWQSRERIRLVFHAFKDFNGVEIDAVKALMSELGEFEVEYAFLHVVDDHPFMLFDAAQQGIKDYQSTGMKGVYTPSRGQVLKLSDTEALITLTGPGDVKRPQDGIPSPVLLKLHRSSTFRDMTYLTWQVYAFSCHSWRSFFMSSQPVTIMYSKWIADLLGHLVLLPRWDPDVLLGRIGSSRWFL